MWEAQYSNNSLQRWGQGKCREVFRSPELLNYNLIFRGTGSHWFTDLKSTVSLRNCTKSLLPPLKHRVTESRKVLPTISCVRGGPTGKSKCILLLLWVRKIIQNKEGVFNFHNPSSVSLVVRWLVIRLVNSHFHFFPFVNRSLLYLFCQNQDSTVFILNLNSLLRVLKPCYNVFSLKCWPSFQEWGYNSIYSWLIQCSV